MRDMIYWVLLRLIEKATRTSVFSLFACASSAFGQLTWENPDQPFNAKPEEESIVYQQRQRACSNRGSQNFMRLYNGRFDENGVRSRRGGSNRSQVFFRWPYRQVGKYDQRYHIGRAAAANNSSVAGEHRGVGPGHNWQSKPDISTSHI